MQRRGASWQDYVAIRDNADWQKLAFHAGWLWADMVKESPDHSAFSDFMTMFFSCWAFLHPEIPMQTYGRCLIENPETQACAPDLVLYQGRNIPRSQSDDPRWLSTLYHRLPDLVGEVADTTLSLDLDEQKKLYASLQIPEYWVIDVKGSRIFAFGLSETGRYEAIAKSRSLTGLPIALVEQALERLATETNTAAASWLMQQMQAQQNQ